MPIRPSSGRIVAIVLLGPIVGSAAIFIAPFIVDPPPDGGAMSFRFAPLFAIFGYAFGLLPSAMAAAIYTALAPRIAPGWLRWVQCLAIGAACGAIFVQPGAWLLASRIFFDPQMMFLGALAGGVALPLTALPFREECDDGPL